MIEIAFLLRIYTLKKKYERNWAKYGRKMGILMSEDTH